MRLRYRVSLLVKTPVKMLTFHSRVPGFKTCLWLLTSPWVTEVMIQAVGILPPKGKNWTEFLDLVWLSSGCCGMNQCLGLHSLALSDSQRFETNNFKNIPFLVPKFWNLCIVFSITHFFHEPFVCYIETYTEKQLA